MSDFKFIKPSLPRRILFVTGLGVAVILALVGAVLWSGSFARQAAIADMEATVARAARLASTSADGLGSDGYYTGDTPQLAQAALQTTLQELAEGFGIQIEVIRADEIEQIDNVVRLNLTVNGVAPEAELGAFLHGLGTLRPIVIVEQLNMRRARTSRSDPVRKVSFQTQLYGMAER